MVKTIDKSAIANETETRFVDLMEDEANNYPEELKFIEKGYQLPIVFINGKASFSGRIDDEKLIEYIERGKTEG